MRRIKPLLLGVLLGILVILLLESLGWAQAARTDPNMRVALVNGEAITLGEVDAAISQRPTPLAVPSASQIRQLRVDVVTAMIDDLLLKQFMREHGAQIDPVLIDKQVAALEHSLKSQNRTLKDYLHELNQSDPQMRANLTLNLQLDAYVRSNTREADMRKYYEKFKEYFDSVTVRTSHIVTRLAPDAPAAEREKAKQQLRNLRTEILAGRMDFAQAAAKYSQCPSAPKGGDIGFIFRKFQNVDEAYAAAAFAMKVGDISDVVETDVGLHLIKVTDRTPGKPTKFEDMSDNVHDCYAEELRMALLNDLRRKAKVTVTLPPSAP
jgi:parvulin-like peptidyl-prolyl isomerase